MSVVSVDALPADPLVALRELTRGEAELEAVRRANVEANADLSEADAMDLAVEEVRAVRSRRRRS